MSARNAAIFAGIMAVGAGWVGYLYQPPTRLTFLDARQGDCAVLQHDGRTVVVDVAHESLLVGLREIGVRRVDLLILTHPDKDHIGGAGALLSAFPRSQVAISDSFRSDREMQAAFRSWNLEAWRVLWLAPEHEFRVGDVRLRLHSPRIVPGQEGNDGSTFVRFSQGSAAAVLTGDAPRSAERAALRIDDWSAQVLKAGHHGSRGSTDPAFVRAVRPEWLVVSCGVENPYGHPAKETLETAARANVKVARTDREGDIVFEIRNGRFVRLQR
jgi:competence protein ComEC